MIKVAWELKEAKEITLKRNTRQLQQERRSTSPPTQEKQSGRINVPVTDNLDYASAGHQAEKNGRGTNTSHMRPKKRQIQANRDGGGGGGALKSSGENPNNRVHP